MFNRQEKNIAGVSRRDEPGVGDDDGFSLVLLMILGARHNERERIFKQA